MNKHSNKETGFKQDHASSAKERIAYCKVNCSFHCNISAQQQGYASTILDWKVTKVQK